MALETLKGVKEIGGYEVALMDRVNGCQVDTLIHAAKHIIEHLNNKFSCEENDQAIRCLSQALNWLELKKKPRKTRR